MSSVIYSTFAGRRENLCIQFRYIDKLLDKGLVSEVHLWDYTRDIIDSIWLRKTLTNENAYVYTAAKYEFRQIPIEESDSNLKHLEFQFGVKGKSDAHIIITADKDLYEIVLGGWSNTRSVIRKNGQSYIAENYGPAIREQAFTSYTFSIENDTLSIFNGRRKILRCALPHSQHPKVYVAGYDKTPIMYDFSTMKQLLKTIPDDDFTYHPRNLTKYKVMETPRKYTWIDYYEHYTPEAYPDHIIIKADDDIVYLNTDGFSAFIESRKKNTEALLVFPNIVNNGVCAYFQSQMGLLPKEVGDFPYDTFQGQLWSSSKLCGNLHNFFLNNTDTFVGKSEALPSITQKIGDRISINMFAVLSKDLSVYQKLVEIPWANNQIDDELHLSVTLPQFLKRPLLIVPQLIVSHLSFYKQIEMGLDIKQLQRKYLELTTKST